MGVAKLKRSKFVSNWKNVSLSSITAITGVYVASNVCLLVVEGIFVHLQNWRLIARSIPSLSGRCYISSPASLAHLPWSEVLPYRSVRIDLVSAWRDGWRPPEDIDFTSLLTS